MSIIDTFRAPNSIENGAAPEPSPVLPAAPLGQLPGQPATAAPAMADPASIEAQYYIEHAGKERRYYKDLEGKHLAFRADAKAVTTKQEDRATISHMLDVAQARGWTELHVRGTAAFKQEVWIEAQARGMAVKGYEPTADDRRNLDARRSTRRQQAEAGAAAEPVNVMTNTTQNPAPAPAQAIARGEIANGWTEAEAVAMDKHLSAKAAREAARTEPSSAAERKAERMSDATDPMHDARREAQADAHKLSPAGEKALTFLEQRIDTQMAQLGDKVKADLRAHAAQALAKREAESGPVKLPGTKPGQKRTARQDGEQAPRRGKEGADEQQPRMSVG